MIVYTPSLTLTVEPDATGSASTAAGRRTSSRARASRRRPGSAYKATHPPRDVITTASVHDFRNVGNGGFTVKDDNTSFGAGGLYGTENDYHSISFNVTARTELYEHNTQFELDYARNFDYVCDRVQNPNARRARTCALRRARAASRSDPPRTQRTTSRSTASRAVDAGVDARRSRRRRSTRADPRRLPERPVSQRHPRRRASRRRSTCRSTACARRSRCAATGTCAASRAPCASAARLPRHLGHHERHGRARGREVLRREAFRVGAARPLLQADGRALLERRLHRRRSAARPEGAVLDGRPRALAVLERAWADVQLTYAVNATDKTVARLHDEPAPRRRGEPDGLQLRRVHARRRAAERRRSRTS